MLSAVPPRITPVCTVVYGHVVRGVESAAITEAAAHLGQERHDLAGDLHGVDAVRRQRRVHLVAAHAAAEALLALVRDDQAHPGRLTDDAARRLDSSRNDVRQQPAHADAADLFVVRQREMQRAVEARGARIRGTNASPMAEKLFMSVAPRPYSRSPLTVAVNGSESQGWPSTGTTSVWPERTMPPVVDVAVPGRQRREQVGLPALVVECQRESMP